MMPQFDATITLGSVLAALGIITSVITTGARIFNQVDKRLAVFEQQLASHASVLTQHAARMEKQDDLLLKISGDLHRILGRIETHRWQEKGESIQ